MTSLPERVLVTGAAGFVGSWLCRRLLTENVRVAGVVRSDPPAGSLFGRLGLLGRVALWRSGDEGLANRLQRFAPGAVINLAGESQVGAARADPAAAFQANTASVWELLDALRGLDQRPTFVHASTEAVYGSVTDRGFLEADPTVPLAPYAASKAAAEIVVRSYGASFDIPVVIARLGNIYGPGDPNRARLIPDLTRAFAALEAPRLRDGRSVRTYLHVDDAIDALLVLATSAGRPGIRGEVFNVAGEHPYTNLDVAHLAREASGRLSVGIIVGESADSAVQFASTEKIRRALDWHPRVGLADGLRQIAREEVRR